MKIVVALMALIIKAEHDWNRRRRARRAAR